MFYIRKNYHDILPNYEGPKFRLISESNTLSRYAYDYKNIPFDTVITELSIANTMFEFCVSSGAEEVVFIGQDLAYVDMKMYAEG